MKKSEKKVTMTTDEKVFNLCVESAKQSENGYTFDLKAVWTAARLKYKMKKQTVLDVLKIIADEHGIKEGKQEGSFILTELIPQEVELTPRMKQWQEMKAKHPDAVLLFRCGDFYESYEEDAEVCAKVLGIILTKDNSTGRQITHFPHHALDVYLPKLIRAGKRVAICDELESPKKAVKKESKEEQRPRGYGRFLTDCEVVNLKAQQKARDLFPNTFSRFSFARLDATTNKEYKNASEAHKGKADMSNLLYVIKVVDGVQYTGKTRIGAYESFLAATTV